MLGRVMVGAVLWVWCSYATAVQSVMWDKTVIELELSVGVEQMVQFSGSADVGVSGAMASTDVFRHLFVNNTAYWTAMQPFAKHRAQVRLHDTGEFVLFDVTAVNRANPPKLAEPIRVVLPEASMGQGVSIAGANQNSPGSISMFELIRYAAQTDHSPARVVEAVSGVREVDHRISAELSALYNHADAGKLDMYVSGAWAGINLYVTAIEVRNRTDAPLLIDPTRLQHTAHTPVNGVAHHFIATAMIRREVGPRGQPNDTSLIYVVTERPFGSVIDL